MLEFELFGPSKSHAGIKFPLWNVKRVET
jgi:hypothetical protein